MHSLEAVKVGLIIAMLLMSGVHLYLFVKTRLLILSTYHNLMDEEIKKKSVSDLKKILEQLSVENEDRLRLIEIVELERKAASSLRWLSLGMAISSLSLLFRFID